jgi:hypothetical protein
MISILKVSEIIAPFLLKAMPAATPTTSALTLNGKINIIMVDNNSKVRLPQHQPRLLHRAENGG